MLRGHHAYMLLAFVTATLLAYAVLTFLHSARQVTWRRSKRPLREYNCEAPRPRSPLLEGPPLELTLAELASYSDGNTLLVALDWHIYDVSPGRKLYGKGGAYAYLAGRDITRPVVLQSEELALNQDGLQAWDDYNDFTYEQRDMLNQWTLFFQRKYADVGYLVKEHTPADIREPSDGLGGLLPDHHALAIDPDSFSNLQAKKH